MEYQNPKIPEGINVSDEHPLKDFLLMLVGVGMAIVLAVVLLSLMAEKLVRYIPFEVELALVERFQWQKSSEESTDPHTVDQQRIEDYLQGLAEHLVDAQQWPEGMPITVHYMDSEQVNAFATLGGNVLIFRGLLEQLPNENALAMVLAHELAHIKHRDPMVAMGRGLTVGIAVMSLLGAGDGAVSQQLVGQISMMASLGFSRDQEQQADFEALQMLQAYYGHVAAAQVIFELFMAEQSSLEPPIFLSTHPLSDDRRAAVKAFAEEHGSGAQQELTKLPAWFLGSVGVGS